MIVKLSTKLKMLKPRLSAKNGSAVVSEKKIRRSWSVKKFKKFKKLAAAARLCSKSVSTSSGIANVDIAIDKRLKSGPGKSHCANATKENSKTLLQDFYVQNLIQLLMERISYYSGSNERGFEKLYSTYTSKEMNLDSKRKTLFNAVWDPTSNSLSIKLLTADGIKQQENHVAPRNIVRPSDQKMLRHFCCCDALQPTAKSSPFSYVSPECNFCNNQNDVLSPSTEHTDDRDKRSPSPNVNIASNKIVNRTRQLQREFHPVNKIAGIRKRNRNKDIVLKWHKIPPFGVVINNEAALAAELEHVDKWGGVDVFKIADLSNGRPLTCIMYTICQKRDMFNKFKLQPDKFLSYVMTLEDHYRNVPYHNSIHAADVVQSVHSLFCIPALDGLFNELEVLSALVASAMHDVDHPGVTNQYQCSNYTELALLYNDQSVLEMHHLAVGFKLMLHEHCDVFEHFPRKQWQLFRKMIIDMVLATDMSKHMQLVATLKTMVETKKVASSGILELDQYVDRIEVLKNLVHCADLSNPMKPLELYKNWTERITNEWWGQGDFERAINSEVSPMCDRNNASVEKSQVMFIDFVVYPLVEIWADLVSPDGQEMLNSITSNKEYFASLMPGSPSPIMDKNRDESDTSSNSTERDNSDDESIQTPLATDQNRFRYYPSADHTSGGSNGAGDL